MKNWILLTILYALCSGWVKISKKKSVEKNSIYTVLTFLTSIAFLISLFLCKTTLVIESKYIFLIFIKSSIIVIAWLLELYVLKKMSIGVCSIINLSTIIFGILLSIIFLGEVLTYNVFIGTIIVLIGLILVNSTEANENHKNFSIKLVILLLLGCLMQSISAIIDKQILKEINTSQLQCWYLGFLTLIYWLIFIFKKEKIKDVNIFKNYWIIIGAICFVVGDNFLFQANEIKDSQVIILTVLKQISVIEAILFGKILFKEKNIKEKIVYASFVIVGIVIALF